MLSLERCAYKFRHWLVPGSLDFILEGFPSLPDENGSLCLNHLYKQCGLCQTPAFHPEVSKFGTCQAEGVCMSSSKRKPLALSL